MPLSTCSLLGLSSEGAEKVEYFVEHFVFQYEKQVNDYSCRLSNRVKKTGKYADTIATVAKSTKDSHDLTESTPIKGAAILGPSFIDMCVSPIGAQYNRNQLLKLADLLYLFEKNKDKLRTKLIRTGIEIFQQYEWQFTNVTANGGWQRAMEKLSEDIVNRCFNYHKEQECKDFFDAPLTKAIIEGKSKRYRGVTTGFPHLNAGRTILFENTKCSTEQFIEDVGLIVQNQSTQIYKYYKKKNPGSRVNFDYRRLFEWEMSTNDSLNNFYEETNNAVVKNRYEWKPKEVIEKVVECIKKKIFDKDPNKMEERIQETIKESVREIKDGRNVPDKAVVMINVKPIFKKFINRQGKKEEIQKSIEGNIVVLYGFAGMGKTELATSYAHEVHKKSVAWLNVATFDAAKESLYEICRHLNIKCHDENGEERNVSVIVREMYQRLGDDTLVVFDDAMKYSDIEPFLPFGEHKNIHVLVTSRNDKWSNPRRNFKLINVSVFSGSEGITFVKENLDETNEQLILDFLYVLDRFPLLLQYAVSYIKMQNKLGKNVDSTSNYDIRDYLKTFKTFPHNLEVIDKTETDYQHTLLTALQLTLEQIKNDNMYGSKALELLNVMAYLTKDTIISKMFTQMIENKIELGASIELLKSYSVVSASDERPDILSMHGSLQSALRSLQKEEKKILQKAFELFRHLLIDRESVKTYAKHITSVWCYACNYDSLISKYISNPEKSYTTHFHILAGSSSCETIQTILDSIQRNPPCDLKSVINRRNEEEAVPLHNAAINTDEGVVDLLIKEGASVSIQKKHGWTPLMFASMHGHLKIVKSLLEASDVKVNLMTERKYSALHLAAENNYLEIVEALVEKGFDTNAKTKYGYTPLLFAAKRSHYEIVKFLLDKDIDINERDKGGFTALHYFSKQNNTAMIKLLLEREDIVITCKTTKRNTPLHLAASNDSSDAAEALLSKKPDLLNMTNKQGSTPLHSAVTKGGLKVVDVLLKARADVNARNKNGFTPLHIAAKDGNVDIVRKLLEVEGINVNFKSTKGNTPLHLTVRYAEIVEALLQKGADINAVNDIGSTPLRPAVENNYQDTIDVLVQHGADINSVDNNKSILQSVDVI